MISVVSAFFVGNDRIMQPPPSHPSYEGVEYIMYTNAPEQIDSSSNWEIRELPSEESPRMQARRIKSLIHEYVPSSDIWLWLDANMLLMEDPNFMVDSYLQGHDICALPHPERHNYWEEAVACSEFFEYEIPNIQNLVNQFYSEGCVPSFLCETGCLIRVNTPKVINFNKIWWEHIKICRRDQISFPYSVWKSNLSLTTFPGTNSHNEIRFKAKDYVPQYQGIVRTWSGGYTDRKDSKKS